MYFIIILTIEINNDNNKNDIVWLILSLFFFSQSAAMCRSTWRKEVIIYVLHSFKCYLHENLDLVIIFFTLLQKKYTDEQIKLLITAIENGSVIGVDRTFNLSSCYVTVLCFKNTNVIRRNSLNSPIMFGPIFLSWDGQEDTYQRFMSHLQNKLKGVQQSSIIFGTDQETGEINAIKACFPQSTHILCIKHLKDNARENLRKTQLQPVVNTILHKIFNEDGLLHSNCEIVYNELERELKQQYNIPYLHHRLLPTLKEKVFLPRLTNLHIPKLWTNNNNESFNRNIKANNNWKVLKLPVLIDRVSDMEQDQMTDIRASIHGRGSYQLTGQAQVLQVSNGSN